MTLSKADVQKLRLFTVCSPRSKRNFLRKLPKRAIRCISECCLNTLKGNVKLNPSQKRKLTPHKQVIRTLASKKLPLYKKKKILIQKGGFLNVLIPAALTVLTSLISR